MSSVLRDARLINATARNEGLSCVHVLLFFVFYFVTLMSGKVRVSFNDFFSYMFLFSFDILDIWRF